MRIGELRILNCGSRVLLLGAGRAPDGSLPGAYAIHLPPRGRAKHDTRTLPELAEIQKAAQSSIPDAPKLLELAEKGGVILLGASQILESANQQKAPSSTALGNTSEERVLRILWEERLHLAWDHFEVADGQGWREIHRQIFQSDHEKIVAARQIIREANGWTGDLTRAQQLHIAAEVIPLFLTHFQEEFFRKEIVPILQSEFLASSVEHLLRLREESQPTLEEVREALTVARQLLSSAAGAEESEQQTKDQAKQKDLALAEEIARKLAEENVQPADFYHKFSILPHSGFQDEQINQVFQLYGISTGHIGDLHALEDKPRAGRLIPLIYEALQRLDTGKMQEPRPEIGAFVNGKLTGAEREQFVERLHAEKELRREVYDYRKSLFEWQVNISETATELVHDGVSKFDYGIRNTQGHRFRDESLGGRESGGRFDRARNSAYLTARQKMNALLSLHELEDIALENLERMDANLANNTLTPPLALALRKDPLSPEELIRLDLGVPDGRVRIWHNLHKFIDRQKTPGGYYNAEHLESELKSQNELKQAIESNRDEMIGSLGEFIAAPISGDEPYRLQESKLVAVKLLLDDYLEHQDPQIPSLIIGTYQELMRANLESTLSKQSVNYLWNLNRILLVLADKDDLAWREILPILRTLVDSKALGEPSIISDLVSGDEGLRGFDILRNRVKKDQATLTELREKGAGKLVDYVVGIDDRGERHNKVERYLSHAGRNALKLAAQPLIDKLRSGSSTEKINTMHAMGLMALSRRGTKSAINAQIAALSLVLQDTKSSREEIIAALEALGDFGTAAQAALPHIQSLEGYYPYKDDAIRKIGTPGSTEESGLEEKGTPAAGLKALLEYVARKDVIGTIALVAESGKVGDVTGDFPALEELAKEAGFTGGVAAILRTVASDEAVLGVPAEYAAQGIPVFVKKEWEGRIRQSLSKLEVAGRVRFVGSAAEAYLVIGDDSVSARSDQVLIAINEGTVSQVTPHLLQELQVNGLLKAGSVVMLYTPLKDSVLVFA